MRILISAGEASGEMYGAELMEALRRQLSMQAGRGAAAIAAVEQRVTKDPTGEGARATSTPQFFGVGGEKMRAAGCDLVVDAKDLAVVGITEILGHLPKIWGLFHKLIAEADRRRPDLAIVIDSPAFNWRVAREMKKRGVPVVYYVCPQFWAWRQGRVRYLRRYVDKALVIFPFEVKFYRAREVDAEFVGHPLAELPRPTISRQEYAETYGLDPGKMWITLMPGSRTREVRMNLPEILASASLLGDAYEFLLPVAPTLDQAFVQAAIDTHLKPGTGPRAAAAPPVRLVADALPALAHSRAAIVASGTATVEAAMMETPFVMVYRVTPLTYLLGRWTVKVPHFAMVNLIAGEKVVPELVQRDFIAENVYNEMNKIIPEDTARQKMLDGLRRVKLLLRGQTGEGHRAADRAAGAIMTMLKMHFSAPAQTAR